MNPGAMVVLGNPRRLQACHQGLGGGARLDEEKPPRSAGVGQFKDQILLFFFLFLSDPSMGCNVDVSADG